MASGDEDNHHHPIYNEEEELDFEEDDDEEDYSNPPPPPPISATNPSPNGDVLVDDEDDDVDVEHNDIDDSTSSSTFAAGAGHLSIQHLLPPPFSSAGGGTGSSVTIGLPAGHVNRIIDSGVTIAATPISYAFMEEKKPAPAPIDESRRLFQRLWTDEDEIELLNGFLEYTSSRGSINSSHHHDTAAFYGQVKSKFQLDFNKNQLVEKLRRLKKKYRTIMGKITSGKEHVFKTPHEQASFEISQKIWSNGGGGFRGGATAVRGGGGGGEEGGGLDDEDGNNHDHLHNLPLIDQNPNLNLSPSLNGFDINHFEKKTPPSSRKRSRSGLVKLEDKQLAYNSTMPVQKLQLNPQLHNVQNLAGMNAVPVRMVAPIAPTVSGEETPPLVATMAAPQPETTTASGPIGVENPNPPHVASGARTETTASGKNPSPPPVAIVSGSDTNGIEERMKNCLSPMFKELLSNVMNMNGQMGGGGGGGGGGGSFRGNSNGLGYAFSPMPLGLNGEFPADVKWRKQQILELEVYSKRLELVQDQIKSRLEELRSMDS